MIAQIIFVIIAVIAFGYAGKQFMTIRRNILLGKDIDYELDSGQSWKNMFLIAFGQKKMFKRWIPAIFHLFIYVAFLFTQIELVEILVDGIFGTHRFFAHFLGGLYTLIINSIEILSLLAFVATLVFLSRRNLLKIPRFHKDEMTGWPKLDGNLILYLELLLLIGITCMNGADAVLQNRGLSHDIGTMAISDTLGPALFGGMSESSLHLVERFGWWLHILVVFGFLNYLPKSKHLHIMLAFPNTYFAPQNSRGEMENMPAIMDEVKGMMGLIEGAEDMPMDEELPEFGTKDVMGLTWKNLLDSYTCTECGRCTSVCPANLTGKKLSPRKILMDIRDRATEIGEKLDSGDLQYVKEELKAEAKNLTKDNFDDGKSLFDYISREELHACTTCNACVEACPVMINPLEPILKMRRYEILTESAGPSEWIPMFTSIENTGAVWQIPDEREKWAKDAMAEDSGQ